MALMLFNAALAFYSSERRLYAGSHVDIKTVAAKAPRSGLKALQHLRIDQPLINRLATEDPVPLPWDPAVPHSGFGYPL